MAIKISKVIQAADERRAAGPPMPKLKSAPGHVIIVSPAEAKAVIHAAGPGASIPIAHTPKDAILKDLYDQLAQVKRDRAQLSSQNAPMVTRINAQLKEKNAGMAEEFMAGRLPMPEIKEHYQRILGLTDRAIRLWDQIKHVEKYGELPGGQETSKESKDEEALKHRLRTVIDALSKTRRKLKEGKAYNPSRIMMWEEKVSHLEAQQQELQSQIKKLQIDVRNEQ